MPSRPIDRHIGPNGVPVRLYVAQHEAGHAVIARVLCGFGNGGAHLDIDDDGVGGMASSPPRACIERRWARSGKRRTPNSMTVAKIIISAAGAEAEEGRYGYRSGDETDCRHIEELLRLLPERWRREDRLRGMALRLVCRHRETIERVADALAEKLKLTGLQIDAMMPSAWVAKNVIGKAHCGGDPRRCASCPNQAPAPAVHFRPYRSLAGEFYASPGI
jgi:hypothetical protein